MPPMSSVLRASFTSELSTPLPPGTTFSQALALLRDHSRFVHTNPLVTEFTLHSQQPTPFPTPDEGPVSAQETPFSQRTPATGQKLWKTYDIVDEIPRLGGLWTQRVEYQSSFLDNETGFSARARAPAGVEIGATWSIDRSNDGQSLFLTEITKVECNALLVPMIKMSLKGSHEEVHKKILAML